MLNLIGVEEALNLERAVLVDVRSPSEFEEATIPGAINVPVLEDAERVSVGSAYRKESIEKATQLGIDYASKKLPEIFALATKFRSEGKNIIIFCWRGGMRSKSICSFLNSLNVNNVYQLVGGYKAYRKYILKYLYNIPKNIRFIVLHGLTGVGKTHILQLLRDNGEVTLDIETLARNSGSVFGNLLFSTKPPSQKMFESYIFNILYNSTNNAIFVESESKRIGSNQIPDTIFERIIQGHHVLITTSLSNRIELIKKDYLKNDQNEKIIDAINLLRKRLGNEKALELINEFKNRNYDYVIKTLIEIYYDPLYRYSIEKYKEYSLTLNYNDINEVLPKLIEYRKLVEKEIEREYESKSKD